MLTDIDSRRGVWQDSHDGEFRSHVCKFVVWGEGVRVRVRVVRIGNHDQAGWGVGGFGDDDGDGGLQGGVLEGETMGLSGDCGRKSGGDLLTDCMLSSSMTVRSLVTHHIFNGTMGVPKDCW